MIFRGAKTFVAVGICAAITAAFLFSPFALSTAAPQWTQLVAREIQAACRDAGTQWMVVVCLLSYLIVFIVLEAKSNAQSPKSQVKKTHTSPRPAPLPAGAERRKFFARFVHFCGQNADAWLCAFVVLVGLRYAVDYPDAARSLQVVVLLTGIVVGKGIALWVGVARGFKVQCSSVKTGKEANAECRVQSAESPSTIHAQLSTDTRPSTINRAQAVLSILILLLAGASQWHPERGMEFFYRGEPRWTGSWDNPNLYGVLMGVGTVLAVGLLIFGKRPTPNAQHSTFKAAHWLRLTFNFCAFALCAYGLLKSYSRGAWLGTAVGLGFLIWRFLNREPCEPREKLEQKASNPSWRISRLRGSLFPSFILLLSILVISFWQFRHTESPLLRRVFSVGNLNDFSWRNRVAAWQGAGRMMWDKPLFGFGWGKAEEVYSKEYRAARLEESAAIQMNDYLMIGISAGGPALVCLILHLGITFGRRKREVRHLTRNPHPQPLSHPLGEGGVGLSPFEAERVVELSTINFQLSTIAAGGAIVLLVGFWFDGGLFKLPTAVVFWVLVELCRRRGNEAEALTAMAAGGASVRASRLVSSLAPPIKGGEPGVTRPTVALRWLTGLVAALALGLTALHLGTPQLAVSERSLNIARQFLVPPGEKADFEFLASKYIWANTPLKVLLQHAHLANYNRTLVNWKLDEPMYRDFVLSPEIFPSPGLPATLSPSAGERDEVKDHPAFTNALSNPNPQSSTRHAWRRPLWEYFYPRIRKEHSLETAAEIVIRNLDKVYRRRANETQTEKAEGRRPKAEMGKSIAAIWQQQEASDEEFARICVAALRAVAIPARFTASGHAEFWNGNEWKFAPQPIEVKNEFQTD